MSVPNRGVVTSREDLSLRDLRPYLSVVMVRVESAGADVARPIAEAIRTRLATAIIPEAVVAAIAAIEEDPDADLSVRLPAAAGNREVPEGEIRRTDYRTVRLAEVKRRLSSQNEGEREETLREVCRHYGLAEREFRRRPGLMDLELEEVYDGDVLSLWLLYDEQHSPSWVNAGMKWYGEKQTQVITFSSHGNFAAIYTSEQRAKEAIIQDLRDGELTVGMPAGPVKPVDEDLLAKAFLDGDTRQLWLRGIHRPTQHKAESKRLTGPNLKSTLGLGDQTFFYSAGLAGPFAGWGLTRAIGVAPHRSTVWAGTCADWVDFRAKAAALLERLENLEPAAPIQPPLSELAHRVEHVDQSISDPYDMCLVASDFHQQRSEFYEGVSFFDFNEADGGDLEFSVATSSNGSYLGRLLLGLRPGKAGATRLNITAGTTVAPANLQGEAVDDLEPVMKRDLLNEVVAGCKVPGWLSIRYGSGHTWNDGVVFQIVARPELVFEHWRWEDFGSTIVTREKPVGGFDEMGSPDDRSLFGWVVREWERGWLACDDGAGEIADFVHFDDSLTEEEPMLSLIHVKASHSPSADRQVSTTDYEVVISQAIKNLRALDSAPLVDRLRVDESKRPPGVVAAAWHDGEPANRDDMAVAIERAGVRYRRRVIIVQPRLRKSEHDAARAGTGAKRCRLEQLETLLLEAEAACRDLGASFEVIGSE